MLCEVDGTLPVYVVGFTIVTALLEVFVRYSRYVSVLKWLTPDPVSAFDHHDNRIEDHPVNNVDFGVL